MYVIPREATFQRVDREARCLAIELRVPGTTLVLLLAKYPGLPALGIVTQEARRHAWGEQKLPGLANRERRLEAARLLALPGKQLGAGPILGKVHVTLNEKVMELGADGRLSAVLEAEREALDDEPREATAAAVEVSDDLLERGERLLAALPGALVSAAAQRLRSQATKVLEKYARRSRAIAGDLAKMAELEQRASLAVWFLAEAKKAPRGTTKLTAADWSRVSENGEPEHVTIALNPDKPALLQVEAIFARAKRMRAGKSIASTRKAEADAKCRQLTEASDALLTLERAAQQPAAERAPIVTELGRLLADLRAQFPADFHKITDALADGAASSSGGKDNHRAPSAERARSNKRGSNKIGKAGGASEAGRVRGYLLMNGQKVWVGKNALGNDYLLSKIAKPEDTWLHAKDRTGSHVLIPAEKGKGVLPQAIIEAAHLAAHHSDAGNEAVVDVQIAERRHLRKPKGAAPGFVVVQKERILVLRKDSALLAKLLEREL
jgi:hypothetical protein